MLSMFLIYIYLVEEGGIFGEIQFGFRKGKNTCEAAFILRQIFDQEKRKKNAKVAFLDTWRAYERIWMFAVTGALLPGRVRR